MNKSNCTITCAGMRTLFIILAVLLGLNLLIVAAYAIVSVIMPEPLQDEIFLDTSEFEPGVEEGVVEEVKVEGEFEDYAKGEETVLVEGSGPYYTYLQTEIARNEKEYTECKTIIDLMNIEDQYWATRENVESDAFYSVVGKSLPGGDLDRFIENFLEESEGMTSYEYLCVVDSRMYITSLEGHNKLSIYEWSPTSDPKYYYLSSYEGIPGVMDMFYEVYPSPIGEGLIVLTGYGDAGYLGWNYLYLNPETHYADLVEKCLVRTQMDLRTEEMVGITSIECTRQYQPE
jgi:hypothetical protein